MRAGEDGGQLLGGQVVETHAWIAPKLDNIHDRQDRQKIHQSTPYLQSVEAYSALR